MKIVSATVSLIGFVAIAFSAGCRSAPAADTLSATPHDLPPLQLIQRIPVPNVTGRIDHFTAYPKRRLLIFAALGNNSMEIVNTFEGKVVQSIEGLNEPQGVVYVPERRHRGPIDYHDPDQMNWELRAMARSDAILFWIDAEEEHMPALTTRVAGVQP